MRSKKEHTLDAQTNGQRHAGGAALAVLVMGAALSLVGIASASAKDNGPARNVELAADEPRLPDPVQRVGPLRRGPDGRIEPVDPAVRRPGSAAGCDKGAICVGAGQSYVNLAAALAVARPKDVIEIRGGTYRESVMIAIPALTIKGVAGTPHFDCAKLPLADSKGCFLLAAEGITLQNLEISGAELSEDLGANGACVRNDHNVGFTLRGVICHGSQNGVLSSGGTILIENSEFYDNGWNGLSHNVYFSGYCSVTVRASTFRDARVGHEFKSRCYRTEISDSTFRSTRGSRVIDIPDGGNVLIYRSLLEKTQNTENQDIIGFTAESCAHPGEMLLKEVRIINSTFDARIRNYDKCTGHAIILQGVTFIGTAPRQMGYVRSIGGP